MSKITLRLPTIDEEQAFLKANNELWEENFPFAHYWESVAKEDFPFYIQLLADYSKGINLPEGHVPCTFFFAFNDAGEIVGRTSIRHELNDFLLKSGGHIGYGVVPSFRRKGHATEILKQSLDYVRNRLDGLDKVLVTCDDDNIGSRKTIESNGGVLENIVDGKMRFWIKMK